MTIRPATDDDRAALATMVQHFLESTPYGALFPEVTRRDVDAVVDLVLELVESSGGFVAVAEVNGAVVGLIAILHQVHVLTGQPYGDELCWWVEPSFRGAGPRLLAAAEAWARTNGLLMFRMVAPSDSPAVGRLYERRGYRALETSYVKTLTGAH